MNPFPVQRADELSPAPTQLPWLIQDLWSDEAVGILGGEPKCCKSFLALDLALAVASGAACLRQFAVRRTGPVRGACGPQLAAAVPKIAVYGVSPRTEVLTPQQQRKLRASFPRTTREGKRNYAMTMCMLDGAAPGRSHWVTPAGY